jgi:hypothetical protein
MRGIYAVITLALILVSACGQKQEQAGPSAAQVQAEARAEEREKARIEAEKQATDADVRARDSEMRTWSIGAAGVVLIFGALFIGIGIGSSARKESAKRLGEKD